MKSKNILIAALVIIVLLIVGGVVSSGYQKAGNTEPIRVAFISSLTGDAGVWGQSLKKGFDFALDEINAKGGVNGRRIEAIYEDDRCDPATAATAYNKTIVIEKTKIVTGTVCSSVAMSVSKITGDNKVLFMASGATDPAVTKQGNLVFRLWVSDDYEARAIAQYAVDTLKVKTFGIAYVGDNNAGISLGNNFRSTVESSGGRVLASESYLSTETDFKTYLTKLINTNADALYLMAVPQQTVTIINQARNLGYKGIILGYSPSLTSRGVASQIHDKSNIYYSTPSTQQVTDFWSNYKEKTGQDGDQFIALGYDSLKIIALGLDQCGEDNLCIADHLLQLKDYQSARGSLNFDSGRNLTNVKFDTAALK